MADRLRPLWDFHDLDATDDRLIAQLELETSGAGRAEVLTQLARVQGLRGEFDACARLLDDAQLLAGTDDAANVRVRLERGRMHRSSGDSDAALPLFQSAWERACASGEHYLAGDAAHMCALAVSEDRAAMEEWTERGLDLGEQEPSAAYWAGPLLNNLGWAYFDAGEAAHALELFEGALAARKRDPDDQAGIAFAEEAVQTAREALG